ncbi:MAG TPA: hypothetical protein VFV38_03710 [Ktedonobacteraceae bacterium]|nr:hypothetical protein [Ktedonobacteraceae bacterium]
MQNPSLFPVMKHLLFPYSGEEPLSALQGLRIVLAWILVFPLPMSFLVLLLTLLERFSTRGMVISFTFAFLSGAFIFGILGVLIVVMSNRAARIRQAWKARNGQS